MAIVHNYSNIRHNITFEYFILSIIISSRSSSNEEIPDERLLEKELYDQAQFRLKDGSHSTAIRSLEALESRFPFGRYAEQARRSYLLNTANSQFEASQSAAERFINLHPRHTHSGYAYYMKGLASFTDDSGLFSRYFQSDLAKREVVIFNLLMSYQTS